MNRKHLLTITLAAGMILPGGLAFAQTKAPFMEGYPFTYEGKVGGLDAWSLPGEEDLWMVLPDGQTVVAGLAFSGRGHDIGSVLLGLEPVDVHESLGAIFDRSEGENFSVLEDRIDAPSSGRALNALEETMAAATPDLERMTPEERDELLVQLVESLDEAQTPEEFQIRLLQWHDTVTGGNQSEHLSPDDMSLDIESPEAAEGALTQIDPDHLLALSESLSVQEITEDVALLRDLSDATMWFGIGDQEALPVYMIYDPSCPFCARALQNLEGRIASGDIHLRVILVPAISQDSLALVAAILDTENPAETLIANARHITAAGRSAIDPVDPASIDPRILNGVILNVEIMQEHGIPGVPFFGWHDGSGPRFFAGVPREDHQFSESN